MAEFIVMAFPWAGHGQLSRYQPGNKDCRVDSHSRSLKMSMEGLFQHLDNEVRNITHHKSFPGSNKGNCRHRLYLGGIYLDHEGSFTLFFNVP